jgi:glycosyltransferase involved in cell wall biosynthesis
MIKRVLICGSPDLNFIDGSSVWAQNIALVAAATGNTKVEFLTSSTPSKDELYAPLRANPNITLLDGTNQQFWKGKQSARISQARKAELAIRLDKVKSYDVIIVRGFEIATRLLEMPNVFGKCWIYLTDIPQKLSDFNPNKRLLMQRIANGCQRLLCQTEEFRSLWKTLVPDLDKSKISLYPPVIPDLTESLIPISERPLLTVYAGKFKSDWMTLEMAETWPAIHREFPGSELVMIGDKIHDESEQPNFVKRMQQALQNTQGLRWLGAQTHEAVQEQLRHARVGLSWRQESMNDTLELSTKILEYGGAGCAAIVNRNILHEQLLGHDYPLFANSEEEFKYKLTLALSEPHVAQNAANTLKKLAERYTFSTRVDEIRQWLKYPPKATLSHSKTRVLIAGHDLKFFTLLQKKLEDTGQFEFLTDQWLGHNKHDETKSLALLDQADVIFCEWCLGNLKWYSHHKQPHQRLVARFHAQETRTPYMVEANWDNIDHVSFVSEHSRRQALEVFAGFPFDKTSVIPNYLDDTKFTPKKKTAEAPYTMGIVGVTPKIKRLDLAVDLLEALLQEDDRFCLRVKGKHPLDYGWLLKQEDELAYYRDVFERINSNPRLRHKVIFDPPGDDVNDWFTMVGFILSPSDWESFHMAIGEGMLTGATPIIWDWDGAAEIWGRNWIVDSIKDAKLIITNSASMSMNFEHKKYPFLSIETVQNWSKLFRQNT